MPPQRFQESDLTRYPDPATPTAALAQTFSRWNGSSSQGVLSTGRLSLVAIRLHAGMLLTSATFVAGGTALSSGSNQWFALYDSAFALIRVTSDDTSTAWSAQTTKTLNFSSTYTVAATGTYYLGICVVATTVPSLGGIPVGAGAGLIAPLLGGSSTSSLTNPASAPNPAATPSAISAGLPWAYVS